VCACLLLWQALGDVEAAGGNYSAAQKHYAAACRAEPYIPHSYTAWARLEASQGEFDRARQLFSKGAKACPGHAPLLHVSNLKGGEATDVVVLMSLGRSCIWPWYVLGKFICLLLAESHACCWLQAWAEMELDLGRVQAAKQLLQQALQADAQHIPSYMVCVGMFTETPPGSQSPVAWAFLSH
jgi:tetratricopeptide (TPR) repeat protein